MNKYRKNSEVVKTQRINSEYAMNNWISCEYNKRNEITYSVSFCGATENKLTNRLYIWKNLLEMVFSLQRVDIDVPPFHTELSYMFQKIWMCQLFLQFLRDDWKWVTETLPKPMVHIALFRIRTSIVRAWWSWHASLSRKNIIMILFVRMYHAFGKLCWQA